MKSIIKSVLFCVAFTGIFIVFSFAKNIIPNNFERLAHGIIGTLAAFLTTILFLKFDKNNFSNIGLKFERKTILKFFFGVTVGILLMGFLATNVMYFTNVEIEVNQKSNFFNFILLTLPLLPLAFMEELGFRAYPLEILKDKIGIRLSIVITSILFALYHIVNGWTIASSFYGPGIWGLGFGLAAIYSKGISMPTGIHYAANLTTSAFGATDNPISIWTIKQSNAQISKYQQADWATLFPALVLLVLAIICIELFIRKKANPNVP